MGDMPHIPQLDPPNNILIPMKSLTLLRATFLKWVMRANLRNILEKEDNFTKDLLGIPLVNLLNLMFPLTLTRKFLMFLQKSNFLMFLWKSNGKILVLCSAWLLEQRMKMRLLIVLNKLAGQESLIDADVCRVKTWALNIIEIHICTLTEKYPLRGYILGVLTHTSA